MPFGVKRRALRLPGPPRPSDRAPPRGPQRGGGSEARRRGGPRSEPDPCPATAGRGASPAPGIIARLPAAFDQGTMTPALTRLIDGYFEYLWDASPTTATAVGIHDHDDRLADFDP